MLTLKISLFYTAILALMLVVLSIRVIYLRRKTQTGLLFGDDRELALAIRAQGNFTEYAPIFLIQLILLEFSKASDLILYLLGALFCIGRVLQAYSLNYYEYKTNDYRFRIIGMVCTFTTIGVAALYLLYLLR